MTLPSQFSLEEENFYKDIQDLLKNSSQNEKELSLFLQRYMDLLAKADLDDESLIINFTKAGLIIEASAKVYGTKVDRLWNNLEHVLLSLRSKGHGQSKNKTLGGEEMEVEGDENRRRLSVNCRRKKKVGDALVSADDFIEIDNITGLLGKNMNEDVSKGPGNLKFCEKVPNMFIKNKQRKKKIDVCLNRSVEEKDTIRLRDWVVSTECLLVKEIFTSVPEMNSTNGKSNESFGFRRQAFESMALYKNSRESGKVGKDLVDTSKVESLRLNVPKEDMKDKSLSIEPEKSVKEPTPQMCTSPTDNMDFPRDDSFMENDFNVSRESDLAKFPNVLGRGPKACLVDVDEVFWNAEKFQDLIPNKKLRSGKAYKTSNPPCKLCKRKEAHQGRKIGKRCINKKKRDSGLDLYFIPHVQPTVGEPQFGILPDEELISTFKQESKIIEQLAKANAARNINEAFHPDENPEELKNFLGFDGFEKNLIRMSECNEDEVESNFEDNNPDEEPNFSDNPPGEDFELPVPITENSLRPKIPSTDCDLGPKDDDRLAESEYQKLVKEGLKDHFEAKSIFAKNKELGIKISKWHEMISDKIKLSEIRGAMNMNLIANKIMKSFPSPLRGELPQMSFRELVKNECRRDVPRYFFGCLQLTNEGNVDIRRTDPRPLATDCMVVVQLRSTRKNCDLDESTARTPTKESKAPEGNKKRNAMKRSPMTFENKSPSKTKRVKQRTEKAYKRQKNFAALSNSKKISNECENTFGREQPTECSKEIRFINVLNEENNKEAENPKRPKKIASDFFQEIDITICLSEENINDQSETMSKIKFYDDIFKIFVKNKTKKKSHAGNKNSYRLKDWIISNDCLLIKEIGTLIQEHKSHGKNKQDEAPAFIDEEELINSLIEEMKNSTIKNVELEKAKESDLMENRQTIERRGIIIVNNHVYLKKPYANRKLESSVPEKKMPVPSRCTEKDNEQGPSVIINRVQQTLGMAWKRQKEFAVSSLPKKRKF